MGNLVASVGSGGTANFYMDNVDWSAARSATFTGAGDVYMELEEQIFGSMNATALTGGLELALMFGDEDFATLGAVPFTTINGFNGGTDRVVFNNSSASAANFTTVGNQTTAAALFAALDGALDGTNDYVFALYNGADINGDALMDLYVCYSGALPIEKRMNQLFVNKGNNARGCCLRFN